MLRYSLFTTIEKTQRDIDDTIDILEDTFPHGITKDDSQWPSTVDDLRFSIKGYNKAVDMYNSISPPNEQKQHKDITVMAKYVVD